MKTILLVILAVAYSTSPSTMLAIKSEFPVLIVGGSQAKRGEFPSIVQIKNDGSHVCGGSIINPNYIVTAAHCTQNSTSGYTIVAGEHILNITEGSEQIRTVTQIKNHPRYNWNTRANDISLMKLSSPLILNANVAKATLATSDPTGDVIVAGWGDISGGGEGVYPNVLMKVTVPMVTLPSCQSSYGSLKEILPGMICAGGTGGKDSCKGDSGGPLHSGKTLSGIASFGVKPCGNPVYPGVYSSIASYKYWIIANTFYN